MAWSRRWCCDPRRPTSLLALCIDTWMLIRPKRPFQRTDFWLPAEPDLSGELLATQFVAPATTMFFLRSFMVVILNGEYFLGTQSFMKIPLLMSTLIVTKASAGNPGSYLRNKVVGGCLIWFPFRIEGFNTRRPLQDVSSSAYFRLKTGYPHFFPIVLQAMSNITKGQVERGSFSCTILRLNEPFDTESTPQ